MKKTGKIFCAVLAVMFVFSMSIPAFAAAWTGSITINGTENVPVKNKVFKAYQVLTATAVDESDLESGVIYAIPAAMQSFYDGLCGGEDGVASVDEVVAYIESADLQAFAGEVLAAAKTAKIVPATAVNDDENNSATFSNIPFGYYVIEDEGTATPISALMLKTTSEVVTIKADKPAIEKKIDGDNDSDGTTADLVDYNTATVGETVPYVIISKVPDMAGYTSYTYKVTDTFSAGLTFNDDVTVTIGEKTLLEETDYTVNSDENGTVTIEFIDFENYTKDQAITIKYSATVNANAVIGVEGNPNTVKLEYSNNPQDSTSKEETPEDVVYTYLADLIINKTDENDEPLEGAVFEVKQGETTIANGTSDADGKVVFTWVNGVGLKDGETYTIVETNAPAGYNKADDITFTVTCTDPETGTECTWSTANELVTFTVTDGTAADYFETTIVNTTGGLLPETGGIGTTIFYIVGGLLVVGAAIFLITKKRMSVES